MSESRKFYSKEFKRKAVELSNVRGNVAEIARELGVNAEFIYRWRREIGINPQEAFSGNGKKQLTEEQKEIARLKRGDSGAIDHLVPVLTDHDQKLLQSNTRLHSTQINRWSIYSGIGWSTRPEYTMLHYR